MTQAEPASLNGTKPQPEGSMGSPVKVLYIGGQGRSGSTVLGRLLGEIDGFIHVGEIALIWSQREEKRLCGCGTPFSECEFWREVIDQAFGGLDSIDLDEIRQTKRMLDSREAVPRLVRQTEIAGDPSVRRYLDALSALYAAVQRVSGAQVIVDGSKAPLFSYVLDRVAGIDLYSLHLVRDSRAVAHSNQRQKSEPLTNGGSMSLGKLSPWRTAVEWNVHNLLMQRRSRRSDRYLRMRYEDIVQDPKAAMRQICRLMDCSVPPLDFLGRETVSLSPQHNVCGNPDRFRQTISIRLDSEWRQAMNGGQRTLVTVLTLPLLARYGYAAGRARKA